ncbi:MAG: hypothetical protein HDS03_00860 [Bacteroides sp.]|nr:hypothetical protein [Bacteroides sp.]
MKKIIEISGLEYSLRAYDENGAPCRSLFQFAERDGISLKVDEKEFTDSDLADVFFNLPGNLTSIVEEFQEGKECYIKHFCEENQALSASIYTEPAKTTIEIEIAEGEEFDPQKAALVTSPWVYPDEETIKHMIVGFLYGDKVYPLYPEAVNPEEEKCVWTVNFKQTDDQITYTEDTASDKQLEDASKLPVLIFRYQTISYCYGPGEEFDVEEYPEYSELEGPGVISAINDAGNGMTFICADSLEYINIGEMAEVLQAERITRYEIELSVTEKGYALLNYAHTIDSGSVLKTISAIWEKSYEFSHEKPAFDKLIFRTIFRDLENYAENHDYLLDNGKIYELPTGKFDEIILDLSEEEQALNKEITPFDEYE